MDTKPPTIILDLDGSLQDQRQLIQAHSPVVLPMQDHGRRIRLGCSRCRYRTFARHIDAALSVHAPSGSAIVLYGSGDFHHVTQSLLMRQTRPYNILVLDKHPDWMRRIPVMHCGTWLNHAARLPQVNRVYHVGGDLDFDNAYRLLMPRDLLLSGRIKVFSAVRRFQGGTWSQVNAPPVRRAANTPASPEQIQAMFRPFAADLASCPLYVTVDKDVLAASEATTNWDAGRLTTSEVTTIIATFVQFAQGRLAGADIVGDWSVVQTSGWIPKLLARLHGHRPDADPADAARRNQAVNMQLLETLHSLARLPS